MSDVLRARILVILDEHAHTGSAEFKSDKDIAAATGQPVNEIYRQLDILESEGLVWLAKAMGPTYGARIEPKRMLLVEQLRDPGEASPSRPVGFRAS